MAVKECFRKMRPVQLYVVLALTVAFFVTELIVSHITHALTLLMDSYHMLCNIMALTGCIITMKYGKEGEQSTDDSRRKSQSVESTASSVGEVLSSKPTPVCQDEKPQKSTITRDNQAKKLKNTFGWARIDVVVMLICCVFLASLSFSIVVEALQTLVHIDHQDEMHHPVSVLCIGATGLLLNGVCYLLIGGYTFHQGSFLYITESGDVVLNKVIVSQSLQRGERRLSRTKYIHSSMIPPKQRQGLWEMARDTNGCILVMICALLIFFTDKNTAKYIDPIISLFAATFIMVLSYPYMKESCLILLQTMPGSFNIDILQAELLKHFPDIVNVHDFHVWQLTANKVISTIHIIFENPKVYSKIMEEVKEFFTENGITQVTIQPEFHCRKGSTHSLDSGKSPTNCILACQNEGCKQNHCCPEYEERTLFKGSSKEILPDNPTPDLISVRRLDGDCASSSESLKNNKIPVELDKKSVESEGTESINEIRSEDQRT